tara:strand:- start:2026 stop:2670 length:645 start_codon:yes stop_codon:yes gene_type:complete
MTILFILQQTTNGILSAVSGLIIFTTLVLIGQRWIRNIHLLVTYLLLPLVAYVITNVISNNLALSLGMIGALSIVRFRNPVRNPMELVMFFSLLTLGIAYAVNIKWGIFLLSSVVSVLLFSSIIEKGLKKFKSNFLSLSFDDSNLSNLLEVQSREPIDLLENNKKLLLSSTTKENGKLKYYYKVENKKKNEILELRSKIQKIDAIEVIEIKLSS